MQDGLMMSIPGPANQVIDGSQHTYNGPSQLYCLSSTLHPRHFSEKSSSSLNTQAFSGTSRAVSLARQEGRNVAESPLKRTQPSFLSRQSLLLDAIRRTIIHLTPLRHDQTVSIRKPVALPSSPSTYRRFRRVRSPLAPACVTSRSLSSPAIAAPSSSSRIATGQETTGITDAEASKCSAASGI